MILFRLIFKVIYDSKSCCCTLIDSFEHLQCTAGTITGRKQSGNSSFHLIVYHYMSVVYNSTDFSCKITAVCCTECYKNSADFYTAAIFKLYTLNCKITFPPASWMAS